MRVGLTSAAFYGRMETEDAAQHLTTLGISCCETFLETYSEYSGEFGALVRNRLGDLPCVSVHPKGTQFEPDLFGQSARQRADALNIMTRIFDAGKALGAKYYVMHGPVSTLGRLTLNKVRAPEERFSFMRAAAAERGMEILWENVFYGVVSSVEDFRAIGRLIPDLHFVLDVKQAWRGHADPMEIVRACGSDIRHVHLLDRTTSGDICLPGEGMFDIPLFLRMLTDQGYNGDVIIEPYAYQTENAEALMHSIEFMQEILHKIGA